MQNSKPSLLMVSIKMVMCNAPLPQMTKVSAVSPGSTFNAKFLSNSRSNLSLMFLEVTNFLPSQQKVTYLHS